MSTTIIIGLGNPGEQYKNTRHNAGFMALDKSVKENNFPDFVFEKKYNAEIAESKIGGKKVILAKPQTFMNNSGKTAGALAKIYKLKSKNFIIIHDDADLPLGKIKIIKERGSAGHKGVESVIKAVGNKDLARIRIGTASKKNIKAENIVLKNLNEDEKTLIKKVVKKAAEAFLTIINENLEKAMNEFNTQ